MIRLFRFSEKVQDCLPPDFSDAHFTSRESTLARKNCYRCHKALTQCICDLIVEVSNKTDVVILQHFRERFHPIGTARLAVLGLKNCRIHVAHSGLPANSTSRQVDSAWKYRTLLTQIPFPEDGAVLFPSKNAQPLTADNPPSALLVLDATWSHAKRLYYENPWIARLKHVSLQPEHPSNYRIRKEPEAHCLSTLEAIVSALKILEPETRGLDELLETFNIMIDRQSQFVLDKTDKSE
ncbi:MAG: hypothetical protein CSA81_09795 [Acidobacteria bacterium]|nr:MAG: hypothetical protein CSA81_09795 [Acidobacteriota bacterium]